MESRIVHMTHNRWKTVVFIDLDYTIMRSPFETVVSPVYESEMARKTGKSIAELDALVEAEFTRRHRDPSLPVRVQMDWDDILRTVADQLGVRWDGSICQMVEAHIGTPQVCLYENVREALQGIAAPERAVVLATDGLLKYQTPLLNGLGLTGCFDEILTPDASNALKKNRAFFGDWPSHTELQIMVGDRYPSDIAPAQEHGFKTVWSFQAMCELTPFERPEMFHWLTEKQDKPPDAIIFSLKELPGVVADLESKYLPNI